MPDFLFKFAIEIQTWIRGAITGYFDLFTSSHDWGELIAVLPLGVLFGFVHALTPGHGKTVLSTYLLGSGLPPLRAMLVALSLALTHVASAVLLAIAAVPLITRTIGGAGSAPLLENVSRALIIVIGLWLLLSAIRGIPHAHGEGIPEAGLIFAAAMMLGITGLLALVSVGTVLARDAVTHLLASHEPSLSRVSRLIEGVAGVLLVTIGANQFL
jgi:nickel/cobalt exporter